MQAPDHPGAPHRAFVAGRYSAQHIAAGLALAGGALVVSSLLGRRTPAADADRLDPVSGRPPALFGLLWPPLFTALTLSGLRLWSAPPSRRKTEALTLWSLLVAFSSLWMALGPRRVGGQLTAVVASLGTAAAYAWQIRPAPQTPPPARAVPRTSWSTVAQNVIMRPRRDARAALH